MKSNIISKMNVIVGSLMLVLAFGCNKDDGPSADIENNVEMTIMDASGEDLLNPDNPNALSLEQIKTYYELDGVKTEINRGNLDNPKMLVILEPSSDSENYRLSLFMNTEEDSEITTTYLEWGPERTDVFESQIDRSGGGVRNEKTWFNGELICDKEVVSGICQHSIILTQKVD